MPKLTITQEFDVLIREEITFSQIELNEDQYYLNTYIEFVKADDDGYYPPKYFLLDGAIFDKINDELLEIGSRDSFEASDCNNYNELEGYFEGTCYVIPKNKISEIDKYWKLRKYKFTKIRFPIEKIKKC